MRRLHARKGMALALLPGAAAGRRRLRQNAGGPCRPRGGGAYLDDCGRGGGVGRGDFTGKAVTAVLSALDTPPVITYLTGDQSLLVSRMLALDELPIC